MSKEIYLAGKLNTGEIAIADFAAELEERGHTVSEKWWEQEPLPTPYLEHPEFSSPAAKAMLDAAYSSDVFILFPEDKILGAAVELGAALASTKANSEKQVILVNPFECRQSVFYVHPAILAVRGVDKIRHEQWY